MHEPVDISNLEEPKPYRMRLATQTSADIDLEPQRKERSSTSITIVKSNYLKPSLSMSEDKSLRFTEAEVNPFTLSWGNLAEKKKLVNEMIEVQQSENFLPHLEYDKNCSDIIRKSQFPRKTWRKSLDPSILSIQTLGSRTRTSSSRGYILKSRACQKTTKTTKFGNFQLEDIQSQGTIPFIKHPSQALFYSAYENADFSMSPGFIKPNAQINLRELLLECKQGYSPVPEQKRTLRAPKRRWFDSEPIPREFLPMASMGLKLTLSDGHSSGEQKKSPPQTPTGQLSSPRAMESPALRKRKNFFSFTSATRKESIQLIESGELPTTSMQGITLNSIREQKKFSNSSDFSLLDSTIQLKPRGLRQSSELQGSQPSVKPEIRLGTGLNVEEGVTKPRRSSGKTRKLSGDNLVGDLHPDTQNWDRSSDSEGSDEMELTMNRQFSVGAIGQHTNAYSSWLKDIQEVRQMMTTGSSPKLDSQGNLGSMRVTIGALKELRSALDLGEGQPMKRMHSIGGSRKINPFKNSDPLLGGDAPVRKRFQVLEHKLKKGAILSLVIIISESTTLKIKIAPGKGAPFETYKVLQQHGAGDESPVVPERKLSQNADSVSSMDQAIQTSQGKFRIVSAKPLIFNKDPIRKKLFSYTLDFVQEMFWFDSLQHYLELVDLIYNDLTNYYSHLMKETNSLPVSSKLVESGLSSALEVSGKVKGYNLTLRAPLGLPVLEYPIILQQPVVSQGLRVRPSTSFKQQHTDLLQCLPLGNLKALKVLLQE